MQHRHRYSARIVAADDLNACDVAAWSALESRAAEPNAYLSPHFVLPAMRWLTPGDASRIVLVERGDAESGGELVGVGVFTLPPSSHRFGLRHLLAYRSIHSFLCGILLDRSCVTEALRTLVSHVAVTLPEFRLIEVPQVWRDGALAQACATAARAGSLRTRAVGHVPRAVLETADCDRLLRDPSIAPRRRDLERRMRRLQERGEVGWRVRRGRDAPDSVAETFLALEHMGWKGEEGSSLRSSAQAEAFFRATVAGFASEGRALFTELTLDGTPIASTCNFVSGDTCFGFKIGWNPAFRTMSPAMLNELELIKQAARHFGDIRQFDSGASPSSYINELWPGRRYLTTLWLPTGFVGGHALRLAHWGSVLKQAVRRCIPGTSSAADASAAPEAAARDAARVAPPVGTRAPRRARGEPSA